MTFQQNSVPLKFCSVAKKVRNILRYWHVLCCSLAGLFFSIVVFIAPCKDFFLKKDENRPVWRATGGYLLVSGLLVVKNVFVHFFLIIKCIKQVFLLYSPWQTLPFTLTSQICLEPSDMSLFIQMAFCSLNVAIFKHSVASLIMMTILYQFMDFTEILACSWTAGLCVVCELSTKTRSLLFVQLLFLPSPVTDKN